MLTFNNLITAGILVSMMAFSPMTISILQDSGPRVTPISDSAR